MRALGQKIASMVCQGIARNFAAADDAIVVCMPQMSPSMQSGKVRKWLKSAGEQVKNFDIVAEIDTDTLTEPQSKVGKFEGTTTMLLESQEDVFWQQTLVDEGREVAVGTPLAVVCEFEEDLAELKEYKVPVDNLYGTGSEKVRMLTWQSYLKSSKGDSSGGCS